MCTMYLSLGGTVTTYIYTKENRQLQNNVLQH